MVAVVDGSIGAWAGCAHGCAIALLEVVETKRKDVVAHDDAKTLQDFV
jgi:hypothetical protein